ncbi:type II toxin -antitoxin system TacA 1-like antitoxin [[Mycobacterium] vasticus]|uniref:DUF1778 domain-containing protein n=1 Tax=[Mycobacterium] vasticus TaxID=2875777 RepID=A0ABU5Z4A0_9MYCO|nr:DUF1778 domain-containing protein [Mycolicibacter sp. MYC017]MEB3071975.1 DUF1778 domain-containing protein [Mycolicibacter sp. MYC017]
MQQISHLSSNAAAAFTAALDRPAQVNERLVAALHRPQKFSWADVSVDDAAG